MTRGNIEITKAIYKGKTDYFQVMIESPEALQKWKKDSSAPLTDVVTSFQVFITHGQGPQGVMGTASNQMLDTEFGMHDQDLVIRKVLSEGKAQNRAMPERHGGENIMDGPLGAGAMGAHN